MTGAAGIAAFAPSLMPDGVPPCLRDASELHPGAGLAAPVGAAHRHRPNGERRNG